MFKVAPPPERRALHLSPRPITYTYTYTFDLTFDL
jgi:hypothetical protein